MIRIRINYELPKHTCDAWYYNMQGLIINVEHNPSDSTQYKLPLNDLFICKKYCTVIKKGE